MHDIVQEIAQYQNQPYNLRAVHEIQDFLENLDPMKGRNNKQLEEDIFTLSQKDSKEALKCVSYSVILFIACFISGHTQVLVYNQGKCRPK